MASRKLPFDQRSRKPFDYFSEPRRFGRDDTIRLVLPPGGDRRSREVARRSGEVAFIQHQVVFAMGYPRDPANTKRVTTMFGFSRQHWSDCMLGKAWMGPTVMAAAVGVQLHRSPRPRDYLPKLARFGCDDTNGAVIPPGGDVASQRVALVQHRLVLAMGYPRLSGAATRVTQMFHFSESHWRRCLRGEAWMGETALAAAVSELLDAASGH